MTSGSFSPELLSLFGEFQDYLYGVSGIFFSEKRRDRLLGHVSARMETLGMMEPSRYLSLLKSSQGPDSEQWAFFDQATVNETYFFREDMQLAVLRDKILPPLFRQRRSGKQARVCLWSAACSSGEEAYSLAMLVRGAFPEESETTSILGFDISPEVIAKARRAEYAGYSVRKCTPQQMSAFFERAGDAYRVKSDVRRLASFQVVNLVDAPVLKRLPRPDVILCRNALIYFDRESKARVVSNFASALPAHGYLFLGQTETLFGVENPFELVYFFKTCGYRHKQSDASTGRRGPAPPLRASAPRGTLVRGGARRKEGL